MPQTDTETMPKPEPRWAVMVATLAVAAVVYVLPEYLTLTPAWVSFGLVVALLVPSWVAHRAGNTRLNDIFGYSTLSVLTLIVATSLGLLILRLPKHVDSPVHLLGSAATLWLANVLLFANWYWRLDGGGPNARRERDEHDGAFLFPQMALSKKLQVQLGEENWKPGFVDYLFLAFNTSTAFSPTDTPVLTPWAKILMIVQSTISLVTLALIAARAVNIL